MDIGIVGAGFIGEGVARLAVAAGHRAMISNSRGPDSLTALAKSVGCLAGTAAQAAVFGDMVLIAVPLKNRFQLPVAALDGRIVIDSNNYYPHRDGRIDELEDGSATTSGLLQAILPRSRVVKCFNAILARDLGRDRRPRDAPGRRALPVAGDDAEALGKVAGFVESLGYDGVDAGPLAESWRFERARPGYCQPLDAVQLARTLSENTRASWVEEGSWRL